MAELGNVKFPRCLFPREDNINMVEVHTFTDASEEAYAAVTCTRIVYRNESVLPQCVKPSTKLVLTKALSVP